MYRSTKLQKDKRNTKQVRLDVELHKLLKIEAASKGILMSSLLNSIIKNYFNKKNDSKE
jgi:hypothetical protein